MCFFGLGFFGGDGFVHLGFLFICLEGLVLGRSGWLVLSVCSAFSILL